MTEPSSGATAWFEAQLEDVIPDLYGAALRLARNEADAQDLVADAIASAWTRLDSLENPQSFRGWVFRILHNRFVSQQRSRQPTRAAEPLDPEGEECFSLFERLHQPFLLWQGANPEREFLDRLLGEDLHRAVDSLPDPFRAVVVLADLEGLAYRDIAGVLGLPLGTVRSRLARGRSRLQRALWEHAVDAGLRPVADSKGRGGDVSGS